MEFFLDSEIALVVILIEDKNILNSQVNITSGATIY